MHQCLVFDDEFVFHDIEMGFIVQNNLVFMKYNNQVYNKYNLNLKKRIDTWFLFNKTNYTDIFLAKQIHRITIIHN